MIMMIAAGIAGFALPQAAPTAPAMGQMEMPAAPAPAAKADKDCCDKMAPSKDGCPCCAAMKEHKDGAHAAH